MRWQTGIVMERIGRHVVLMTPKGDFTRVKITGRIPEIGEEVRIPVVNKRLFNVVNTSWIAVAASVILIAVASPLLGMNKFQPMASLKKVKSVVAIQSINVPNNFKETAKKKGLSPGKYAVLIEAVNEGLPLTEKDINEKGIVEAITSVGGEPEKIINKAIEEKEFGLKEQRYFAILSNLGRTGENAASDNRHDPELASVASGPKGQPEDAEQNGDSPDKGDKKSMIEPIRRGNGPEDRTQDEGTADNGNTQNHVPAAITATVDPQGSNSGKAGSPEKTGGENINNNNETNTINENDNNNVGKAGSPGPDSTKDSPAKKPGDTLIDISDKDTYDNYMGPQNPDNPSKPDNVDMNVLKPNF